MRAVDLNAGRAEEVRLHNDAMARVELLELSETRDDVAALCDRTDVRTRRQRKATPGRSMFSGSPVTIS